MALPPTTLPPSRIIIVDDHPLVRAGLGAALLSEPGLSICGEAESARAASSLIEDLKPDLVLVDLDLDGASGLDLIRQSRVSRPALPFVVLSMHEEELYAERALRAGARGYIMKSETPAGLVAGIRTVLEGGIAVSDKIKSRVVRHLSEGVKAEADPLSSLSDRELEVFREIGKGAGTRKIAEKLCLSVKTVETHVSHIKRKLQIGSATELQLRAFQLTTSRGLGEE